MKVGDLVKHAPSGAIGVVTTECHGSHGAYVQVYWLTGGRFNDDVGYISVIEASDIEVIDEDR